AMMLLILPMSRGFGGGGLGTLVALGKTVAAGVLIFLAARFLVPRFLGTIVATRRPELFLLAVLFVVLGTALATSWAGLSLAIGAFLAGLVVSGSDLRHQARADVAPFRDAFNALFFVSVGMLFDTRILIQRPATVAVGLGLVLLGKAFASALPVLLLGWGPRVAVIVGISLAQIGEFAFVLLEQGRAAGLVPPDVYQVTLAATIISMAATPFLFRLAHVACERAASLPAPDIRRLLATEKETPALPNAEHVLVFGFGHMGETLARVLARAKVPFRVL